MSPAPGLFIIIVFPIPVSFAGLAWDVPIASWGLKYISMSSLDGNSTLSLLSGLLARVLSKELTL